MVAMKFTDEELEKTFEDFVEDKLQQVIMDLPLSSKRIVTVDYETIELFNPTLAEFMLEEPERAFAVANHFLSTIAKREVCFGIEKLFNTEKVPIRMLRQEHIGKYLALQGIVRRATEIRPRLVEGAFQCSLCGAITKVMQPVDEGRIEHPSSCDANGIGCGKPGDKFVTRIVPEQSRYVDTQEVELTEAPEGVRGGAQPERIVCMLEGPLTDNDVRIAPGDRVILNSIVRARSAKRGSTTMYLRLDVMNVEFVQHEYEELEIEPEEEAKFEVEAKKGEMLERISSCIAPSIHGMDTIKIAMALQQFGGQSFTQDDGTVVRGDIHILLVGDPGIAKTVLIRSITEIAPRTIFAVGGASSRVGMTATAVRDETTGRWTLEAGALVLADKGVAIIDEIDKMEKQDMASMHEAMEQQTVTVTKAGINATLRSRCSVLGALNPKYGRFIVDEPLPQQIELPPALLSRFDLVFTLRDIPNKDRDRDIATHIGKRRSGKLKKPEFESDFIKKYIAYARTKIERVEYAPDADTFINKYYVDMRAKSTPDSVAITARQIEGIYRLAEASARARLSSVMELQDAKFSVRIVHEYLSKLAIDSDGHFDIDRATSDTSSKQRTVLDKVLKSLRASENGHTVAELIEELQFKGEDVDIALDTLSRRTIIFCNAGVWRMVR